MESGIIELMYKDHTDTGIFLAKQNVDLLLPSLKKIEQILLDTDQSYSAYNCFIDLIYLIDVLENSKNKNYISVCECNGSCACSK